MSKRDRRTKKELLQYIKGIQRTQATTIKLLANARKRAEARGIERDESHEQNKDLLTKLLAARTCIGVEAAKAEEARAEANTSIMLCQKLNHAMWLLECLLPGKQGQAVAALKNSANKEISYADKNR